MSESNEVQRVEPSDLLPLTRYLNVLIGKYPKPITPKQLSKLSKVTLAAVSKVRDRLFPVCDVASLGSPRRRLLLKGDLETVTRIGFTFYIDSKFGTFLRSPYAQIFLRKSVLDAHSKLAGALPGYSSVFDQNDALFLERLGVRVITEVLDDLPKVTIRDLDSESLRALMLNQSVQALDRLWPILALQFKDVETLEHILAIRDKIWYVGRGIVRLLVPQVLSHLIATLPDDKTRQIYLNVYFHTADYYLGKILSETFTENLRKAASDAEVVWKESYNALGAIFPAPTVELKEGISSLMNTQRLPALLRPSILSKGAGIATDSSNRA